MIIRCPECDHMRSVSESQIPPTAELATCPKCRCRFRFRTLREPGREPDEPGPEASAVGRERGGTAGRRERTAPERRMPERPTPERRTPEKVADAGTGAAQPVAEENAPPSTSRPDALPPLTPPQTPEPPAFPLPAPADAPPANAAPGAETAPSPHISPPPSPQDGAAGDPAASTRAPRESQEPKASHSPVQEPGTPATHLPAPDDPAPPASVLKVREQPRPSAAPAPPNVFVLPPKTFEPLPPPDPAAIPSRVEDGDIWDALEEFADLRAPERSAPPSEPLSPPEARPERAPGTDAAPALDLTAEPTTGPEAAPPGFVTATPFGDGATGQSDAPPEGVAPEARPPERLNAHFAAPEPLARPAATPCADEAAPAAPLHAAAPGMHTSVASEAYSDTGPETGPEAAPALFLTPEEHDAEALLRAAREKARAEREAKVERGMSFLRETPPERPTRDLGRLLDIDENGREKADGASGQDPGQTIPPNGAQAGNAYSAPSPAPDAGSGLGTGLGTGVGPDGKPDAARENNSPHADIAAPLMTAAFVTDGEERIPPGGAEDAAPPPERAAQTAQTDRAATDARGGARMEISFLIPGQRSEEEPLQEAGTPPEENTFPHNVREKPSIPPEGSGPAWEHPAAHGWFRAFTRTVGEVMFNGPSFFSALSSGGTLGQGYLFFLILGYIAILSGMGWSLAAEALLPGLLPLPPVDSALPLLIIAPVALGFMQLFAAAFIRLILLLFAPDQADFGLIHKIVSYAAAPFVLSVVPFVGPPVASLWFMAELSIGCRKALGLSPALSLAAPLPPALALVAGLAWYFL